MTSELEEFVIKRTTFYWYWFYVTFGIYRTIRTTVAYFFLWSGIYTVLGGTVKTVPRKLPVPLHNYSTTWVHWYRILQKKKMESVKWWTFNDNFFKFRSSHLYFWIFASIKRIPLHFLHLMHQTLKSIKWIH